MKFIKALVLLLTMGLFFWGCEKEHSIENGGASGNATGTLKSGTSGDCLPSSVQGIYMAATALTTTNYINVDVDFTSLGAYTIVTNQVNGYSFSASGVNTSLGIQTIRLNGTGTPVASGANTFTVTFGTSQCNLVVDVLPAGTGAAVYTLGGAGGTCTGAVVAGTYTVGTATTTTNTVTLAVNVTSVGTYSLTVPASNGISFSGAGSFTATGAQSITLSASGTPTAAGSFNSTATVGAGSCTFSVTTTAASAAAVYTLNGAPATCTGFTLNGSYMSGVPMAATNSVVAQVTVTTPGTYSITTAAVNGVTFVASGSFATAGAQSVTLTASGTPASAGVFNYTITGAGGTSCTFSVTYTAAPSGAVFTLAGSPGNCTPGTVAGTYTAGTALTSSNTVTIQVNVTTIGSYSISTNTVNGYSFSASGTFSATGTQSVTLIGSGTPSAASTGDVFTPTAGTSTCTFSVTVVAATPTNFLQCKIDGGTMQTFNVNLEAQLDNSNGFPIVVIYGEASAATTDPSLLLGMGDMNNTSISPGTYTVNQDAQGIIVGCYYYDAASNEYFAETDGTTQTPGFTLVITSITATRVSGTFSGTVKLDGTGTPKVITEGSFSVAF
ncbi:MAG: hypothetical protein QM687_05510 [Ferruginibacter sp.]